MHARTHTHTHTPLTTHHLLDNTASTDFVMSKCTKSAVEISTDTLVTDTLVMHIFLWL